MKEKKCENCRHYNSCDIAGEFQEEGHICEDYQR